MAKKGSGNRIDVDLKLMQQQDVKLLMKFGEDFKSTVNELNNALKSYGQQVAGHAGAATTSGFGQAATGRSRPSGPTLDPNLTGHRFDPHYATTMRQTRQAAWANISGGGPLSRAGSGYSFAPAVSGEDLFARMLSGNIGEFRSRDFFQYASMLSGAYGGKINQQGMPESSGRTGAQSAMRMSNRFAAVNMGVNVAQSGMAFSRGVSQSAGMGFDVNAPYSQLGYSAEGIGGTTIGSQAWQQRFKQGVGSRITSLRTAGWGMEQERDLREKMLGFGLNPQEGKNKSLARDIRDISKSTGLAGGEIASVMQHTARFGTKEELADLTETFADFSKAADHANMTTKMFSESVAKMAQAMMGQYGMSQSSAIALGSDYTGMTGLPGDVGASFMGNQQMAMFAMGSAGKSSMWDVSGGDVAQAQLQMITGMVGASPEAITKGWEGKGGYRERMGQLRQFKPEAFGGMDEDQIFKFIKDSGKRSESFNLFSSGMGGKNLTTDQMKDMGKTLIGGKEWKKLSKELTGDYGKSWSMGEQKGVLKRMQKAMKDEPPMMKLGLTNEAKKLVKQMGGNDNVSSRNKGSSSHEADVSWGDVAGTTAKRGAQGAAVASVVPGLGTAAGAGVGSAVGAAEGIGHKMGLLG